MAEQENYTIEETGEWRGMSEEMLLGIIGSFVEFSDEEEIPFEKFDFTKEGDLKNYYQNKFPKFTEEVVDILVKCTKDKVKLPDNKVKIEQKKTVINWD